MSWLLRVTMRDMLPPANGLPGIEETGLDAYIEQLRREVEWSTQLALFGGALAVFLTPLLTVYLPVPSVFLSASLRDRHIDRICGTRLYFVRQAIFLLKMYACFCWGQHPKVREHFALSAYPPDPMTFRTT